MGPSSHCAVKLDGKEVYRKASGSKQATLTRIELKSGRRYPLEITYFEGGSAAFWMEQVDLQGMGDLRWVVDELGLAGPGLKAARCSRDKQLMKRAFLDAGEAIPRWCRVVRDQSGG